MNETTVSEAQLPPNANYGMTSVDYDAAMEALDRTFEQSTGSMKMPEYQRRRKELYELKRAALRSEEREVKRLALARRLAPPSPVAAPAAPRAKYTNIKPRLTPDDREALDGFEKRLGSARDRGDDAEIVSILESAVYLSLVKGSCVDEALSELKESPDALLRAMVLVKFLSIATNSKFTLATARRQNLEDRIARIELELKRGPGLTESLASLERRASRNTDHLNRLETRMQKVEHRG